MSAENERMSAKDITRMTALIAEPLTDRCYIRGSMDNVLWRAWLAGYMSSSPLAIYDDDRDVRAIFNEWRRAVLPLPEVTDQ